MRVRWTTDAASDLAAIVARIRGENAGAAQRVARTIYRGVAALRKFPNRGRVGLVADTRELFFAPWPYIAVYENSETKCACSGFVTLHGIGPKLVRAVYGKCSAASPDQGVTVEAYRSPPSGGTVRVSRPGLRDVIARRRSDKAIFIRYCQFEGS